VYLHVSLIVHDVRIGACVPGCGLYSAPRHTQGVCAVSVQRMGCVVCMDIVCDDDDCVCVDGVMGGVVAVCTCMYR